MLCHVPVSHYSEKVRWALDHKRVPHTRRWPPGGFHPVVSFILTRGKHQTVPVLVMDGEGIGDSTEIIRRLEECYPDPALYPADPEERRRALELEDFFDEEIGPYVRRMAYHHLTSEPDLLAELALHQIQYGHPATIGMSKAVLKRFLDLRFSTDDAELAKAAEDRVVAALDRLDAELEGRTFLAGESFGVADLTAASLLYPMVMPPQVPWRPSRLPDAWSAFNEAQRERPAYAFVERIYAEHRAV
jgi:glutathione S-transferase